MSDFDEEKLREWAEDYVDRESRGPLPLPMKLSPGVVLSLLSELEDCREESKDLRWRLRSAITGFRRPSETRARRVIRRFLRREGLPDHVRFTMREFGDTGSASNKCGWMFWVHPQDSTSYLKEDLSIEWYGTSWGE